MFEEGSFRRRPRGFRRKCPLGGSPVSSAPSSQQHSSTSIQLPVSGSALCMPATHASSILPNVKTPPICGGGGGGGVAYQGGVASAYDMFGAGAAAAAAGVFAPMGGTSFQSMAGVPGGVGGVGVGGVGGAVGGVSYSPSTTQATPQSAGLQAYGAGSMGVASTAGAGMPLPPLCGWSQSMTPSTG